MPRPGRRAVMLLAALALAVTLAGCDSKKKITAELARADAVVAAPPVPTRFALNTPNARTELALPAWIDRYPELHLKLFNAGKQELMDFTKQAAGDRARLALKGVKQASPYERRVAWTITAVTPDLISLRDAWFDDTGGAHPDHGSEVLLWDRTRNVMLLQSELFKPGLDTAPLDDLLCQATTLAKQARLGPSAPNSWSCPQWSDAKAVLVPSTRPYRIGGMMFLFDPYVIGAYAEGDYEVLIPLSDFQQALAPAWAKDFTGSPAPTVKTRP
jgi:hypothetical protein